MLLIYYFFPSKLRGGLKKFADYITSYAWSALRLAPCRGAQPGIHHTKVRFVVHVANDIVLSMHCHSAAEKLVGQGLSRGSLA